MANTIARATGHDRTRTKEVHRLGSVAAGVTAATYRTFADAYVHADGSGFIQVMRDGKVLHIFSFAQE